MDTAAFIERSLYIQEKHYKKLKNISKIVDKVNPLLTVLIEDLSKEIDEIQELVLDALEVPNQPSDTDKYLKEDWTRSVLKNIMSHAVKDLKTYKKATINLVIDWKNLDEYTVHVKNNKWFYTQQLLDDYTKVLKIVKQNKK